MKIQYLIQESAQALRANKLRSSLTIVGIVVGIFAVTAMLALGEGLQANVLDRISSFSQGDVSVTGVLSQKDLEWIASQPYVAASMGSLAVNNVDVIAYGQDFDVTVQSVLGQFNAVQSFDVLQGTAFDFNDSSYAAREAVVTKDLDDAVVEETGRGLLGQTVTVGSAPYTVVAIIDLETAGFRQSDGSLYVPYRTAVGSIAPSSNFATIGVKLKDSSSFEIAGKSILEELNTSRYLAKDSDTLFNVTSAQSIIESAQETTGMISVFLGIVGGIALFVGGIGTMNMMLTTVSERTKEIGLRKAIGARRRDILLQILFESVVLTLIGGVIGVALAALLAVFANKLLAESQVLSVIVSWNVVVLATLVSIAVGIVFGLYPANRASRLQPVDALRAE